MPTNWRKSAAKLGPTCWRAACAETEPKERTVNDLYNQRPTLLDLAHKRLDDAVFDAYGWPHDLTDDEILARLLALNLEQAGRQ
jgi:hypothetical protein